MAVRATWAQQAGEAGRHAFADGPRNEARMALVAAINRGGVHRGPEWAFVEDTVAVRSREHTQDFPVEAQSLSNLRHFVADAQRLRIAHEFGEAAHELRGRVGDLHAACRPIERKREIAGDIAVHSL